MMTTPRVRFTSGRTSETLTVDYRDVLEQAISNERWRMIRAMRDAVESIATEEARPGQSWDRKGRTAAAFKRDLLSRMNQLEIEQS